SGPAGLWQFVSHTARHHGVPVHKDYDGRLSPAESTRAAVEYLRKLNGMLGGNWRLTAMAYNAGESRVLQALRRSGNVALEATPGSLQGLSPITYAYVDKLHALACVLSRAGDEPEWMDRLDRPVLALEARQLEGASKVDTCARGKGQRPGRGGAAARDPAAGAGLEHRPAGPGRGDHAATGDGPGRGACHRRVRGCGRGRHPGPGHGTRARRPPRRVRLGHRPPP